MTLRELSYDYKEHGDAIALRIRELRAAAKETEDPERKNRLERRVAEARELAVLTRHYYDRRYHKNGKYTL